MDKMLKLIDSIKQNIPDQKYIELMQALAEVKGSDRVRRQFARITKFIERRQNQTHIYRYLPLDVHTLDVDEVSDEDLEQITLMLIISIDHLVEKIQQLEQDVLWSVTHAQNYRKNLSYRNLEHHYEWAMVRDDSDCED